MIKGVFLLADQLRQLEENRMKNNNFRNLLGIEIKNIQEGYAELTLPIDDKLLQSANMVHGGVFSVLIDSVIGTAIRSVLDEDTISVTAEMNINYFRPATKGMLRATGKVLNAGRTLAVGIGDIFDENGKLLATGRATYVVKKNS